MFESQCILIIGTVWPEPKSSAAGTRMMQLIEFFQEEGANITFACSASNLEYSEDLGLLGIKTEKVKVNDSSFDLFISELNPKIVLFDRFMTEEQFGWRVAKHCSNAIRILDTEDIHSLRYGRHKALKEGRSFSYDDLYSDEARREIASIYRCDLSLIISKFEFELLIDFFLIDPSLLHYVPFMMDKLVVQETELLPSFENRVHFISIGNFLHEPNWDGVRYLKEKIWGSIRKELPDAEMHIYGAYTSAKVEQLHNVEQGFFVKGRAESVEEVMKQSRMLLAPLRFGAGLKGKLVDAMRFGTPSITTNIGTEGLMIDGKWGGAVENSPESFAEKAIQLYQNKPEWKNTQQTGFELFDKLFDKKEHQKDIKEKIGPVLNNLDTHRKKNFIGSVFLQNTLQSYKYMSKWIEEKNKD